MSTSVLRFPAGEPLRCRGWLPSLGHKRITCDVQGVAQCPRCAALEADAADRRRRREERALTRKLQTTVHGPAPDGEDVWKGFRD